MNITADFVKIISVLGTGEEDRTLVQITHRGLRLSEDQGLDVKNLVYIQSDVRQRTEHGMERTIVLAVKNFWLEHFMKCLNTAPRHVWTVRGGQDQAPTFLDLREVFS